MDEKAANEMQKALYDTAGFWKYLRRVDWSGKLLLETVIVRVKEHLRKLEGMLEEGDS